MITIRKAQDRGRTDFGWLDSRHSFSFGHYYDPKHMDYSALRVINDDMVKPGSGFATHGHSDMEIITFVLSGEIEHKDSEGNIRILPAGEFQLMSAGKGIYHSEYNASDANELRLLQIWIEPNVFSGKPGYQQKAFAKQPGLTAIATAKGEKGSLKIKQDAKLQQLILEPNSSLAYQIEQGRKLYIHQVAGTLLVDSTQLVAGDGAKVDAQSQIVFSNSGNEQIMALVFDLP